MFVYLTDDITRKNTEQHPPRRAALYTEWLSSAKLLPHTAHSSWQPHRLNLVNVHQMARPAYIR